MQLATIAILACGIWPWIAAWRANRAWSLSHAVLWGAAAWGSWGVAALQTTETADLVALALMGAAGVAVLGARRPHVLAWNFVVLGLVGVMLLPLVEAWVIGARSLGGLRQFFLLATAALGISNYVPTRFGFVALLAAGAGAAVAFHRLRPDAGFPTAAVDACRLGLLAAPWIAFWSAGDRSGTGLDGRWRAFRDRYGLVWAQRVREQFRRAAQNAGWPIDLEWQGFVPANAGADGFGNSEDVRRTLDGLLKRFEPLREGET